MSLLSWLVNIWSLWRRKSIYQTLVWAGHHPFPLPLLWDRPPTAPWHPLAFPETTFCSQSADYSPQEHIGKDILAHGPRNITFSTAWELAVVGTASTYMQNSVPGFIPCVSHFFPPKMAANSGQLFIDFGSNEDWEEAGLKCVGTPGLYISASTKQMRCSVDSELRRKTKRSQVRDSVWTHTRHTERKTHHD